MIVSSDKKLPLLINVVIGSEKDTEGPTDNYSYKFLGRRSSQLTRFLASIVFGIDNVFPILLSSKPTITVITVFSSLILC